MPSRVSGVDARCNAGPRLGDKATLPLVWTRSHVQGARSEMSSCAPHVREDTLSSPCGQTGGV